jgi:DNA-binding LacI/PurR family transcriptional regulator
VTAGERLAGYEEALSKSHLSLAPELIWQSDYSERSGWDGTMRFLDLPHPPSAILAANYSLTVGSLLALNERGIKIPQGMSFIGFEILELSRVVVPRLHVIATPLEEFGLTASALLYGRIRDGKSGPPAVVRLSTQLQKGESVMSHR